MRARSGTMASSSRSRIVRRYISVVSTRSVTPGTLLLLRVGRSSLLRPVHAAGLPPQPHHHAVPEFLPDTPPCAPRHRRVARFLRNGAIGEGPVRCLTVPSLTIPSDLLPADGRFGCGPS